MYVTVTDNNRWCQIVTDIMYMGLYCSVSCSGCTTVYMRLNCNGHNVCGARRVHDTRAALQTSHVVQKSFQSV
jgi:hypothetical protein